jgi:parallel beta-helix repeat protein
LPTASNDPSGSQFSILAVHESDSGILINGTGNTLQNSTISYSAGTGVALEGSDNTIRNNLIQYVDYVGDYASGIVIDGNDNVMQNNTIRTVGRQAILPNAVVNEDISYNNLYGTMMLSQDGAAIYACCNLVASGTRIHHNWIHDTKTVADGLADTYPMSGVTLDFDSQGFEVDQNVVWSNQRDNIHIYGGVAGYNINYVHNNTIPDDSSHAYILIEEVTDCSKTRVANNQIVVSVKELGGGSACELIDNSGDAPGATEMTPSTQVGCNFDGCGSNPPPAILGGSGVTPCPAVATDSQLANHARSADCGKARTQREPKNREVSSVGSARKELPQSY